MHVQIGDIVLELLKEKAIWIADTGALLLSDLHLGKAGHFRKAGIPVSESVHGKDYRVLEQLFTAYRPQQVYFLGDLFHSDWNAQWEVLEAFLKRFPATTFHLIKGNHDILPEPVYQSSVLQVHEQYYPLGKLVLRHEPMPDLPNQQIQICGHIHPGITLRGKGRQRMKLPCFFIRKNTLLLPAFGAFTGLFNLKTEPEDLVYLVTPTKVIPMNLEDKVGLVASGS